MLQTKDLKSNSVVDVAHTVFNHDVDNYLEIKEKTMDETLKTKALHDAEKSLNRSLLTLLGVMPETNDVSYSGTSYTPTINLSETLSVTAYNDAYYFVRQNTETKEVDYYTVFKDSDNMYCDVKNEINIIYPESKHLQKTFKN